MKLCGILEREGVVAGNPNLAGGKSRGDSEHVPVALSNSDSSQRVVLDEHAALIALSKRLHVRVIAVALLVVSVCVSYGDRAVEDNLNLSVVEDSVGVVDAADSVERVVEDDVVSEGCPAGLNETKADLARRVARSVRTLIVDAPLDSKSLKETFVACAMANFVSNGKRNPHYRGDLVGSDAGAWGHCDAVLVIIGRKLLADRPADGTLELPVPPHILNATGCAKTGVGAGGALRSEGTVASIAIKTSFEAGRHGY